MRRSSRIRNNSGSGKSDVGSDSETESTTKKRTRTARKKLELDPIEENKEVVFSPPRSKNSAPVEANNTEESDLKFS